MLVVNGRTVNEIKTKLTAQHGPIALTTTAAAETVVVVGCFTAILLSQLHHRRQLHVLTVFQLINLSAQTMHGIFNSNARFLKLELSRESRVIPGTRNSSVLATANLGLSSE